MTELRTAVFYFSGTGNTELIAKRLAEALERKGHRVDLFRIEELLKGTGHADYNAYSLIGIGHPVLGFGASGIVERFVQGLPQGDESRPGNAFVFKTASSPHYVNHSASDSVIRTLRTKGYRPFHNSILAMPCNFFFRYDDRLNKQLYTSAIRKVERMAGEIAGGTPRTLRIHPLLGWLLRIVNYFEEQKGAKYFAKGLRASPSCTACMKCIRDCPVSNITAVEDGIRFGTDCIWCMRCIYSCQQQAIHATRLRGSVVEPYTGGIHISQVMNDASNDGIFVTERSKGYYKHFIDYFKQD
jgi:flavodoxin/ferredoxin